MTEKIPNLEEEKQRRTCNRDRIRFSIIQRERERERDTETVYPLIGQEILRGTTANGQEASGVLAQLPLKRKSRTSDAVISGCSYRCLIIQRFARKLSATVEMAITKLKSKLQRKHVSRWTRAPATVPQR